MEFIYRVHAIERMFQRDISEEAVELVVKNGEIIEEYLDDKPFPVNGGLEPISSR